MKSCLRRVQMNSTTKEQMSWMEQLEPYMSLLFTRSLLSPFYLVDLLFPSDLPSSSVNTGPFASSYCKTYGDMQYGCLFYPEMLTWLVVLVGCSPLYHNVFHG